MIDIEVPLLLGAWVTRRLLFASLAQGLIFGMLAMGIVLIFRSTRVINFAVGNLGIPGAALFGLMVINYGFPFWIALVVALAIGALIGGITEVVVIKRLFERSRVVLLIATVGIADFWRAVVILGFPEIEGDQDTFPVAIPKTFESVGGTFGGFAGIGADSGFRIAGTEIQTMIVVPLTCLVLGLLIQRTLYGRAISASADNPDLSRLSGINPHVVSTVVWTLGGFLATLSMILLSSGRPASNIENLGPFTLTNALAAAVVAGMRSYPRAMAAGVGIALLGNVFNFNVGQDPGLSTFVVFLAVIVALYWQSRRGEDESMLDFAPKPRPLSPEARRIWWIRHMPRLVLGALLVVIVAGAMRHQWVFANLLGFWEGAPDGIRNSQFLLYSTILCFAIVATSLTVITGWSGQVSLGQMAYAGIGGLSSAAFNRGVELDIGWGETRFIDVHLDGLPVIPSIVLGALFTSVIAALTGIAALRVRGILLAVSTFAFAIAAQQYLYRRPFFSDGEASVTFDRGSLFGLDLSDQRTYFLFCLACITVVLGAVSRLRRSGVGRAMIAVRDNPDAAAAYTLSPPRVKLTGFAVAGGIAGLGGGLFANAVRLVRFGDSHFQLEDSLSVVNMVVIGGLGSVLGPLVGAVWIQGLPAVFAGSPVVGLVSSSIGLLVVLMYFPGGLIQIATKARDALIERHLARQPEVDVDPSVLTSRGGSTDSPTGVAMLRSAPVGEDADADGLVLAASDLTVRFGGKVALNGASIGVARNEIVGLIGTNGAGKSTMMNAIGGFVPSVGRVTLLGRSVEAMPAPARASLGLGRTFQAATLFPGLTVRETVQVALSGRHRFSLPRNLLYLDGRTERRVRNEADELIDYLGLGPFADNYISDLSTGTRRIVELAGLLAVGATMLCLDEPTAGVAQREAEAFGPLIVGLRAEIGASMLIIEHDMPLIMSVSDRVYCLEAGSVIAEGLPDVVRNDPLVVRSYLGGDTRAIERSDAK